ncbi:MAG: HlyD family secretion protein [Cryobacterium sp.]|nr:HlyD family secretion protein [Oligoflexia bacterium]
MSSTQTAPTTIITSPTIDTRTSGLTKKKKIGIAVGTVALIAAGYFIYDSIFFVSTDNAQIRANSVLLSARVSGYVTKVNVEENQKVKAGEILAEIDQKDFTARTSQSKSEMEGLAARARDAQTNARRLQELFTAGAVTGQQRDSAVANATNLQRQLDASRSGVDLTQNALSDTQIRAPSDGVIAKRGAEVGMLATPGTPLFGFVSSESRWIMANFKETDLKKIKLGNEVDIDVDAISQKKYHGIVESLSPSTGATFSLIPQDNATGNFTKVVQRVPVRVRFEGLTPEDIDLLKAGLSADVKVHVK